MPVTCHWELDKRGSGNAWSLVLIRRCLFISGHEWVISAGEIGLFWLAKACLFEIEGNASLSVVYRNSLPLVKW